MKIFTILSIIILFSTSLFCLYGIIRINFTSSFLKKKILSGGEDLLEVESLVAKVGGVSQLLDLMTFSFKKCEDRYQELVSKHLQKSEDWVLNNSEEITEEELKEAFQKRNEKLLDWHLQTTNVPVEQ